MSYISYFLYSLIALNKTFFGSHISGSLDFWESGYFHNTEEQNRRIKDCARTRTHRAAAFARGSAQYDVNDSPRRDDGGAWTRS